LQLRFYNQWCIGTGTARNAVPPPISTSLPSGTVVPPLNSTNQLKNSKFLEFYSQMLMNNQDFVSESTDYKGKTWFLGYKHGYTTQTVIRFE
jgi:hypothetical protein